MIEAALDDISDLPEFDGHKMVVSVSDDPTKLRGVIAIHRGGTPNHPAFGATRLWKYDSFTEAVRDALRLSRLMSYKSAIAGFNYGGAKGVIMVPDDASGDRKRFFETYAEGVDQLKGGFITGTDVGVTDDDIKVMKQKTPYIVGSQLDPAYYTAIGVVEGIRIALAHALGSDKITGRTFAIQGLGKVGSNVLKMIYRDAEKIYIADIDPQKIEVEKKQFPNVIVASPDEIHKQAVDVFVPCALSGVISERSIPELHCKIVAGSANNQLASVVAGVDLDKRGIFYAPDYMINVGGYIGVVDEYENGAPSEDRILKRIANMQDALEIVFEAAKKNHLAPSLIADRIAEKLIQA